MKYPYLLLSDLHAHKWSQFSKINADGVNSRLQHILDEIDRGIDELKKAGGDTVVIAGDLFHERGKIDPETFNPVARKIKDHRSTKFRFIALPGNHDLTGKETTELGNAFQSFKIDKLFDIATTPSLYESQLLLIPWCSTVDKLHEAIENIIKATGIDAKDRAGLDLIIHAGIDGVLKDMPDHGLSAAKLAAYGFRRVFAGHYHNHKDFGNGVYSIGATTHQTWSDVGTRAGFSLVYEDRVQFFASHAPEFIDLDPSDEVDEWPLIVPGKFVRVRGFKMSNAEVEETRKTLLAMNAAGVVFQVAREETSIRSTGGPAKVMSMEASLANYITKQIADATLAAKVDAACKDILSVVTTTS